MCTAMSSTDATSDGTTRLCETHIYKLCYIQLKALWGGHTAALQFMLCIQFPIGEGKHAIRSRRLPEDEIVTACTAGNSTEMVSICIYVGLPKHVLHELSLLKYRERRAFLHKMRPDAMQKNGNFTSEPCDNADDAKCSFRNGAINENYTFFQWILQISACNKWCKKGAYKQNWRA